MTLGEDSKADFLQAHSNRYRPPAMGFCGGRGIGMNSECNWEKWEFVDKGQGGEVRGQNTTKRSHQGFFRVHQPNGIPAGGRRGPSDITWGWWGPRHLSRY